MIKKNKIATQFLGVLMTLAMLFPLIVQFEHLFEEHEHIACSKSTSHLHESDFDCNLYDFHISSMDIPSFSYVQVKVILNYSQLNSSVVSLFSSEEDTQHFLRGPPLFQQYC